MSETTSRVLQLLGLLQSRRVWTGEELAERLGVTTRSVRRDVERLRDLGYPVHASKGHGGGYQLGAGAALPPLLLDPDEAVAMAVCLRLAAGGSVAGVGESALRALSKLDQVMPSRLRSQVSAVHDATVTLTVELVGLARRTRRADDAGAGLPRPRARDGGLRRPRRQRHRAAARALSAGDDRKALVSAGVRPRPPGLAQPAAGPDGRRARARQHVRARGTRPTRRHTCGGRSALRRTGTSRGSATSHRNRLWRSTSRRHR